MFTLFCMPNFVSNLREIKINDLNVSVPMNGENSIRNFAFSEELNERSDSFSSISLPRSAESTQAGLSLAITKFT